MKVITVFILVHLTFVSCNRSVSQINTGNFAVTASQISPKDFLRNWKCDFGSDEVIYQSQTRSAGITWSYNDLKLTPTNGEVISFCELSKRDLESILGFDQMTTFSYKREVQITSLAGSLLSVSDDVEFYFRDGSNLPGPPSANPDLYTLDLSAPIQSGKPKRLVLTDIFDAREIYRELIKDKEISAGIREANDGKIPKDLQSLKILLEKTHVTFGIPKYPISPEFLQYFSIESLYGNRVKVNLMFPNMQGRVLESVNKVIVLPIPERLKTEFEKAASNESGYLGSDLQRISQGNKTVIEIRFP